MFQLIPPFTVFAMKHSAISPLRPAIHAMLLSNAEIELILVTETLNCLPKPPTVHVCPPLVDLKTRGAEAHVTHMADLVADTEESSRLAIRSSNITILGFQVCPPFSVPTIALPPTAHACLESIADTDNKALSVLETCLYQ